MQLRLDTIVSLRDRVMSSRRAGLRVQLTRLAAEPYLVDPTLLPAKSRVSDAVPSGPPTTYVHFSKVIVSLNGRSALVRYSVYCGPYCGWGGEMWFSKSRARVWKLSEDFVEFMN